MEQSQSNDATTVKESLLRLPKWTVMIYLAGDNNLSANSIAILQELEAASYHKDVHVVACFDSNTPRPRGARYLEINQRRFINPRKMDWGLHNDLVPPDELGATIVETPDFCTTDPKPTILPDEPVASEGLSRFLEWALKKHEAERYMLIVFGHGTAVAGNTFLADENPPSFLRLKDFAKVLGKHFVGKKKLDLLACDNCVMNSIETAFQIKRQVNYMLGSQDLMLVVGWPYRKIIDAIVSNKNASTETIALKLLKACARSLVDFSLMDRSSEQAVCDLTKFDRGGDIITAIKDLAGALKTGLAVNASGEQKYPRACDAVRLARLQAQSYWDETFVDLYDFCEFLLNECNKFLQLQDELFSFFFQNQLALQEVAVAQQDPCETPTKQQLKQLLLRSPTGTVLREIAERCKGVLDAVREFVRHSYYIGPELQYSHGVSIYFPWTLPQDPLIFEPICKNDGSNSTVSQTSSTAPSPSGNCPPVDYLLKTAFEEYQSYDFAKPDAADWAAFLDKFFRATLRNVRRVDYNYKPARDDEFILFDAHPGPEAQPPVVNLQKSSSDAGFEQECKCNTIKNYPRRFYLSPADCGCVCKEHYEKPLPKKCKGRCVSYLGWNIRGLTATVIGLPPFASSSEQLDEVSEDSKSEPEIVSLNSDRP